MNTDTPAASAARAIALAILRHCLTAAGTALVAHGVVDQGTVNDAVSPIADEILGAVIVAGAAGWSWCAAHLSHSRWRRAWAAMTAPEAPPAAAAPNTPPEASSTSPTAEGAQT